eukprot:628720-Rhodomonas_salina.1
MLVQQQEAAWEEGVLHKWEEAREEEAEEALKCKHSPGLPSQPSLRRSLPPITFSFFTVSLSYSSLLLFLCLWRSFSVCNAGAAAGGSTGGRRAARVGGGV